MAGQNLFRNFAEAALPDAAGISSAISLLLLAARRPGPSQPVFSIGEFGLSKCARSGLIPRRERRVRVFFREIFRPVMMQ
jgi:hypothetical protein